MATPHGNSTDPHQAGVVKHFGAALDKAAGVVILLHGRGGTADDILSLATEFGFAELAFLAPNAAQNSWYPYSFLAPIAQNEPWLTSALQKVEATLKLALNAGIPFERIVIGGFSQGACLSTEFVARNPRRYAGLIAFTGGLIGPPEADFTHEGNLSNMPVLFCSGDPDPHVPWSRVEQSARVLQQMGALVSTRRYPGRAHTVSGEELQTAKEMLRAAFRA